MAKPSLGRSAHTDTFTRDNLPPPELWPEISLKGFDYPETLNAGVELTDRMVGRGFGDHVASVSLGGKEKFVERSEKMIVARLIPRQPVTHGPCIHNGVVQNVIAISAADCGLVGELRA